MGGGSPRSVPTVLVLAKLDQGRAGYYVAHLADVDLPGSGLSERPGRFAGELAAALGLADAAVEHQHLEHLLAGHHPATGATLHAAATRVRVAAFDLTFAAPKSISVLQALGTPEVSSAVTAAHEEAVADTLAYLETHAAALRQRRGGADRQLASDGLLVAAFVHRTSRASEPHLHTHAVVANLAGAGGELHALDARPLYLHLRTASALYDAGLRAGLRRSLGVAFRPRGGSFEIAGLPDRLLDGFSSRRDEIEAALAASGHSGRRAAAIAAARTRPPKDRTRSYPELVDAWRAQAHRLGVSDGRFTAVLGPGPAGESRRLGRPAGAGGDLLAGALVAASEALEAPFSRRELLGAAARQLGRGASAAELSSAADALVASVAPQDHLGERPARLGGPTAPVPAGRDEPRYRSARLRALEDRLAHVLDRMPAAPAASAAPASAAPWRPEVLRLVPSRHLEALAALAEQARSAAGRGLAVRAHAPSPREAAAFSALTGIPTEAGDRLPLPSPGALVLVVAADRQPMAALDQLLRLGEARAAPVLLLVGPTGPGRPTAARPLLLAAARPLAPPAWHPDELLARGADARSPGGPVVADRLEQATGAVLAALVDRLRAGERVVLVAPDRAAADALGRLAGAVVRPAGRPGAAPTHGQTGPTGPTGGRGARPVVVEAAGLAGQLATATADTLVVLGPPLAGRALPPTVRVQVDPVGPLTRPTGERILRVGRKRDVVGLAPAVDRLNLLDGPPMGLGSGLGLER